MSDDRTRDVRAPAWSLERTDLLAPTRVIAGKYRLGRLLGEGGMGAVYEAEHLELGSKVAVKLLSDHYATNPTAAKRVRREARAMAAIRHDNIVTVSDTGSDEGTPYIVMELLEGESLSALLKREGRLSPTLAVAVVLQVLDGLAAAHAQGVVHRDLKPGNIFLSQAAGRDPRVKILDFGVSKYDDDADETALTVTGAAVGTPLYMAPEQIQGAPQIDGRADLYALGVMLYRMVTGVLPGANLPAAERRAAVLQGELPPPRSVLPSLPAELDAAIVTAMQVEPDARFADAQCFRSSLAEAIPEATTALSATAASGAPAPTTPPPNATVGPTRRRGRLWLAASILAVLAIAPFASWIALRNGPEQRPKATEEPATTAVLTAGADEEGAPALLLGMTTYVPVEIQEQTYGPIAAHLAQRLGQPVELAIFHDSEELVARFRNGELALAALNPAAYVEIKEERPRVELLATPVTDGGASFEVHIVAAAGGGIESLDELENSIFCYVPSAPSGYLFPRDILRRAGLHPDDTFSTTRLADDHLAALRHVASGRCDATAVYTGLLYELKEHGMSPHAFRTLATSGRIPNDAYCAHDSLGAETVEALREALLELAPDSAAAAHVFPRGGEITGFAPAEDAAYERIREALAREAAGGDPRRRPER